MYNLIRADQRTETDAIVLLDTSTSMNSIDTPGGVLRRIDLMARVLAGVLARVKVSRMVGFSSYPYEIPLGAAIQLEEPTGSTALHLALDHLTGTRPARVMVLSDGDPDSEHAALEAMGRLQQRGPCAVHCYHVGPDHMRSAIAFLARLAAMGAPGSSSGRFDLQEPQRVAQQVVGLLTHG